jgi:hypothetical protein
MMYPVTVTILIVLTACGMSGWTPKSESVLQRGQGVLVYLDPMTGSSVSYNVGPPVGRPRIGDNGESGPVNPALIEYIFAAPESPFARYYDLVLSLANRPDVVNADLAALDVEARREVDVGASPRGRDYARALGRNLIGPVLLALAREGALFQGVATVRWGIPVDLDAGVPLVEYESGVNTAIEATILRYQQVALLVVHSNATRQMLTWDVSEIPGAFQWNASLDRATVAARIVALHPVEP